MTKKKKKNFGKNKYIFIKNYLVLFSFKEKSSKIDTRNEFITNLVFYFLILDRIGFYNWHQDIKRLFNFINQINTIIHKLHELEVWVHLLQLKYVKIVKSNKIEYGN